MPRRRSNTNQYPDVPDDVPPAIRILVEEPLPDSHAEIQRALKKLAPELHRQATWTQESFVYMDETTFSRDQFIAVPAESMNPIAMGGICVSLACRYKSTLAIARSMGLYADVLVLRDDLTPQLELRSDDDLLGKQLLLTKWVVLKLLEPMIRAGVVRFRPYGEIVCRDCRTRLDSSIQEAANMLADDQPIQAAIEDGELCVDLSNISGGGLIHRQPLTPRQSKRSLSSMALQKMAREVFIEQAVDTVWDTVSSLKYAETAHGSLFTTMRAPLRALKAFDGAALPPRKIATWEDTRSVQLPWVEELTVPQILQLRQEADEALPAFRSTFVQKVMRAGGDGEVVAALVDELRDGAEQIRIELNATRTRREQISRTGIGILAMGFSIYGAATGDAAAVAGLLSVLGLLHGDDAKKHRSEAKAHKSPAYVLVKAKEIIDHAE